MISTGAAAFQPTGAIILQAILTICGTVITAVIVFVAGQLVQRIFIEPVQEQRKNVAKIAQVLTIYRNIHILRSAYDNNEQAKTKIDLASDHLKQLATDLRAGYSLIPMNDFFARLRLVPDRETVRIVAIHLIRWATFASDPAAQESAMRLSKLLKLDFIATEDQEFNDVMIEAAKKPALGKTEGIGQA